MAENQFEAYVMNIKNHYEEEGFEVNPYTQEEIDKVVSTFGDLPTLMKLYLSHIGRIEEESQFEKSVLDLKHWSIDDEDMLVFADYGPSCENINYGIKKSDLSESNPVIYVNSDATDDEWEKWDFNPEEDCHFEDLSDFFLCAAKENTDISIEEYRANRKFWNKLKGED